MAGFRSILAWFRFSSAALHPIKGLGSADTALAGTGHNVTTLTGFASQAGTLSGQGSL